jgi:hypothetical protein
MILSGITLTWFIRYHWVVTSVGGLLIHESIIRPVVSTSTLTWFIRYHWVVTSVGGLLIPESIIRPVVSTSTLTISYKPCQCRGTDYWTNDTLGD